MFTGIIETTGVVVNTTKSQGNQDFLVQSAISNQLKIDQSVAHNGVCLTVVEVGENWHRVTAIAETLQKSNLAQLNTGNRVNLERCLQFNGRLDGHLVQGHVDQTGICVGRIDGEGSWFYTFEYDQEKTGNLTIEKGSICVNGVSLTVVNAQKNRFSVAIIPYTYEHTNFKTIEIGITVNLEFDVLGKYIQKYLANLT